VIKTTIARKTSFILPHLPLLRAYKAAEVFLISLITAIATIWFVVANDFDEATLQVTYHYFGIAFLLDAIEVAPISCASNAFVELSSKATQVLARLRRDEES